jgi:hypothetical protein
MHFGEVEYYLPGYAGEETGGGWQGANGRNYLSKMLFENYRINKLDKILVHFGAFEFWWQKKQDTKTPEHHPPQTDPQNNNRI